jgi:ACT domain-containing protein
MDVNSFFPVTSFFFNQILEDVNIKGVILSQKIMELFDQDQIYDLFLNVDLSRLAYEKYEDIMIYVIKIQDEDQIWLVKYRNNTILMMSSEY